MGLTTPMTANVDLRIHTIDAQGYGIGQCASEHRPIRVWGCTIGDHVRVRIVHRSPHRLVGQLIERLGQTEHHPEICPHRPSCGGCPQWEAPDPVLLQWRTETLAKDLPWLPFNALPSTGRGRWRTRSKWRVERSDMGLVFTVPRPRSDEGLAIPSCPILPQAAQERLELLRSQLLVAPLDTVHGVVLTEGKPGAPSGAGFGIGLIANHEPPQQRPPVGAPEDAVAWLHQSGPEQQVYAGQSTPYSGPRWVAVEVSGDIVPTPPFAFVQAHPVGREQIRALVLGWAGAPPSTTAQAIDLGSGTGFFARPLARQGWTVDAVEPSHHVAAAWEACPPGIRFHPIGAESFTWPNAPELVIMDPPRSGMQLAWLQACITAAPQRIIAVHCGRAAAIRDLTLLRESGYKSLSASLADLFPGSPHGELVSLWERQ